MDNRAVLQMVADADLSLVRFLYCDNSGIIRGKVVPAGRLARRLSDGLGLSRALLAVNSRDELQPVAEMTPIGEVRLLPDPESFTVLPYATQTGALFCDLVALDRTPWDACARSFLKRICRQVSALGLEAQVSFESEYTLLEAAADGYRPYDETLCYSSIAMQATHDFTLDLVQALEKQDILVELCHPELSPGQHEVSIGHRRALQAADDQLRVRETVRAVAATHGLVASFAPKPLAQYVGNGTHIHVSLWDSDGRNVFYDPQAEAGLSKGGRAFLAGLLRHLPGLTALTAASVSSYRRLEPHSLSGAYAIYGYDNREAAIRIPSPFWSDAERTTHLEFKTADASANPYLALGALLAAGLEGLSQELEPGPAVDVDPATLSEYERRERGIQRLPQSLDEALDCLLADLLLTETLGPLLCESYVALKRSEALAGKEGGDEAGGEPITYRL
ncbi:MAG: glutamine synthetase family protein [Chloroflexota bacterium]